MTRRLPDHAKVIRGTFRKDRAQPVAQAEPANPRPPTTLTRAARRHWRELFPQVAEIMSDRDRNALALTCEALAEHEAASAVLAAEGYTYEAKTEAGTILVRERPEVRIASGAWTRALRGLAEFGLTPASRNKVPQPIRRLPNPFQMLDR